MKKISSPDILQALVLADSFDEKFRPITYETPRALLPLVGVPLLDYTIEFLATSGVQEIFVFCVSHAHMIQSYLAKSKWVREPSLRVMTVISKDATTAGDALREMYEKNVLHGDFILVSGDIVSTMNLKEAVKAHKERRQKDKSCVMTMVYKKAAPSHRTRSLQDDIVVGMDANTGRLLYLDNNTESTELDIPLTIFAQCAQLQLRYDLLDCYIDICSLDVLSLFADNFDYADIRKNFVQGILAEEIYGQSVYTYVISGEYAARVKCLRTYDSVSKDIFHRWTYPMVPDNNLSETRFQFSRGFLYKDQDLNISRYSNVEHEVLIGKGTMIGDDSNITHSVIGRNCKIGKNVTIKGSYIWDNVQIEDGVTISKSIICSGVVVREKATIEKACLISYNVVIGKGVVVPSFSKVTLAKTEHFAQANFGLDGKGVLWLNPAETPEDRRTNSLVGFQEEARHREQSAEEKEKKKNNLLDLKVSEESRYMRDLKDMVFGAIEEEKQIDLVEINSIKFAYNISITDSACSILVCLLDYISEKADSKNRIELLKSVIAQWAPLIAKVLDLHDENNEPKEDKNEDMLELIYTIQEYCKTERKKEIKDIFPMILHTLFNNSLLSDSSVFEWADQQKSFEDKTFLLSCKGFLDWLKEDVDDDDDDEEEEEEEE